MLKFSLVIIGAVFVSSASIAQDAESFVAEWAASAHAEAGAEAFTHWNEEGEIPATCAVCHAGAGFRDFYGLDGSAVGTVDTTIKTGGVIDCDTCHAPGAGAISQVQFPSGLTIAVDPADATCTTCHQGRVGGMRIQEATADGDLDTVNPELGFMNPHYKAAAATLMGHTANGLYQYVGRNYVGAFEHVPGLNTCTSCHSPHSLEVNVAVCTECHGEQPLDAIRARQVDWDGDGDVGTGVAVEIETLRVKLVEEIKAYAQSVVGEPVAVSGSAYPYFFADTNGDGEANTDEAIFPNRYANWTPRMLRAAYNYQFIFKDPGAFAHNPRYAIQALYDSIEDLGGDVSGLVRP